MVSQNKSGAVNFGVKHFFGASSFYGLLLFEKNWFLSSMNCYYLSYLLWIAKVLTEGFLHNLCPCFDIVFAQLGVIPRTRNRSAEVAAVVERYLIITHLKNKESKKQSFWIRLPKKISLFRKSVAVLNAIEKASAHP